MALFVRAVETGSFSLLARELGKSQPTVSKQVAQLERHLGIQLLHRSPTGLVATEAGTEFYERAKTVLDTVADMQTALPNRKQAIRGTLRVSCPVSFGQEFLTPVLIRCAKEHPELAIEVILTDSTVDLVTEGVDVAIRFGPLTNLRLVARRVGESRQVCVATPAYLQKRGLPVTPHDLMHHACVVNNFVSPNNRWQFRDGDQRLTVQTVSAFRANNLRVIRDAVLADLGVAVGPVWLYFDDLSQRKVTRLLQNYEPLPLEIHALHHSGSYVAARVRMFIDTLEQTLADIPAFNAGFTQTNREEARRALRETSES